MLSLLLTICKPILKDQSLSKGNNFSAVVTLSVYNRNYNKCLDTLPASSLQHSFHWHSAWSFFLLYKSNTIGGPPLSVQ